MATKAERDQRLDELVQTTKQWSEKRQKELNDRVASLKRILEGRGEGQLLNAQQEAASALVVDEINQFLTG